VSPNQYTTFLLFNTNAMGIFNISKKKYYMQEIKKVTDCLILNLNNQRLGCLRYNKKVLYWWGNHTKQFNLPVTSHFQQSNTSSIHLTRTYFNFWLWLFFHTFKVDSEQCELANIFYLFILTSNNKIFIFFFFTQWLKDTYLGYLLI
jgi:hypothetical protein